MRAHLPARADRDDGLHTGLAEPGPDPIQTFVVGEEDDRARVREAVLQLGARPPR